MKNARVTAYTPDAIREAGEIIAAAILQGGGSGSVSWEQIVLTGTKIAEITINGETIEVYAPSGGGSGSSVSWDEIQTTGVKIAEITIDGTTYDVYAPDPDASDIDYDNSTSGLVATDVQAAIDEVYAETSTNTGNISDLNTEVGAHDTAISNLQTAVSGKANESIIAPVETSLTASRAYAIGEQFIYTGVLYTATAAITAGGTITIGGNCTASNSVADQITWKYLNQTTGNTEIEIPANATEVVGRSHYATVFTEFHFLTQEDDINLYRSGYYISNTNSLATAHKWTKSTRKANLASFIAGGTDYISSAITKWYYK